MEDLDPNIVYMMKALALMVIVACAAEVSIALF